MSGFEIIALLLATPQAIKQLIEFGKTMSRLSDRLRHPESLPEDLKCFGLESDNRRLARQIDISYRIYKSPHYDKADKDALDGDFKAFQQALVDANMIVNTLLEKGKIGRALNESRYMKKLADQVSLVGSRRRQFMETIDLVHIKDSLLSFAKLEAKWFTVSPDPLFTITETIQVFRCHLTEEVGEVKPHEGRFLLEMRKYDPYTKEEQEAKAKDLAETLSTVHGSDHILDCIGYVDLPASSRLGVVFAFPEGRGLFQSLDHYIQAQNTSKPSLDVRVKLCKALAAALLQVHTLQKPMVHKNINPSNMMLFLDGEKIPVDLLDEQPLFLINWQLSRAVSWATNWIGVSKWWMAVYQHPTRQIAREEKIYTLDHDIYSLGVCMIEILLWQPLIRFSDSGDPKAAGLLFDADPSIAANVPSDIATWDGPDSDKVAKALKCIAENMLPPIAGKMLSTTVLKCMNGLNEPKDALGAMFTSVVKDPLDRINI
ncbi:hypothetical protein LTR70_008806 [Exophiala xenobiotica]|uniref:Protein kinase domain-containing protein n=1 Tax=Lithohypha guttulata TaxID=1690604 RepID=A0ABR0JYL4_9EURO|nr:hypothetical protein LTR24_008984 [Lithohypha guttulata]KAK5311384.1 hypothetical protein LTR70_008806 [Exophiala xenobiotica]